MPLLSCLFFLLLIPTCKNNDIRLDENNVVLAGTSASVYGFSTGGWDLSVFVTVTNRTDVEGYLCKAEYRFLLNDAVIATVDNLNPAPLPDSSGEMWRGFVSTTNWQLPADGSSIIKYFDTGLHSFMNGQRPQKVEITLYIRNGSSQGDWDFMIKAMAEIIYNDIIEE
jgi:hypothetical protein